MIDGNIMLNSVVPKIDIFKRMSILYGAKGALHVDRPHFDDDHAFFSMNE